MVDNNSTNCTLSQDTIAVAPLSSVRRGRSGHLCARNLLHKFVHIVYVTSVAKSSCKISKMIKRQASCMSLMFYICNKILYSKMNSSNPPVN